MRRDGSNPEEYLAGLTGWHQAKTGQLRRLLREAVPTVTEEVRSGALYYHDDGDLFAIAAQKNYVSLYVFAPSAMDASREVLAGLNHGKGCIRFRSTTEVPEADLTTLLQRAVASGERDCRTR